MLYPQRHFLVLKQHGARRHEQLCHALSIPRTTLELGFPWRYSALMARISPVLVLLLGSLVGVACGGGDEGIGSASNRDDKADGGTNTGKENTGKETIASSDETSGASTSTPASTGTSGDTSGTSTNTGDTVPFGEVIGIGCKNDSDCTAPTKCIRRDDSFAGSIPGTGICTMPCEVDADCVAVDGIAYCDYIGHASAETIENTPDGEIPEGFTMMCMQLCPFGQADPFKCGGLDNFMCVPLESVVRADDNGQNQFVLGGCAPVCHADTDCDDGEVCDFGWGLCVPEVEAPAGKGIGETCKLGEEDECASGFCLEIAEELDVGVCTAACNFQLDVLVCGGEAAESAVAGCLGSVFTPINSSVGDMGQCIPLCDTTEDCPTGLACDLTEPELTTQYYGRPGFCFTTEESIADALANTPTPDAEDAGTGQTSDEPVEADAGDGG